MSVPHPTEVLYLEAKGVLRVTFSDDLVMEYPTALLRGFCPCARCQGHGGGPATWTPNPSPRANIVENVSPVGTYAFCVSWGDGHDTGIYSFEMLRRIDVEGFDEAAMNTDSEIPLRSA